MGASNSTPQTAHIINPKRPMPAIQVTPNVINRLESTKQQIVETAIPKPVTQPLEHCPNCCACSSNSNRENRMLQIKSDELQEKQFQQTLHRLQTMLGKPIHWNESETENLQALQKRLIKCHSDNPKEPLRCSAAAKEYQKFVLKHQYEAMLAAKNLSEEED